MQRPVAAALPVYGNGTAGYSNPVEHRGMGIPTAVGAAVTAIQIAPDRAQVVFTTPRRNYRDLYAFVHL